MSAVYAGIDLGTTNSAICTYDGAELRLWKSPEQNDVTPSAIYYDRRARYVGRRAYDMAARDRDRAAVLFKRLMGTSTPIRIAGLEAPLTPEECSAEILRTLFGYLPAEVREQVQGTVITVPAAFNQMQKDATLRAAELAGIGAVALMQEPVAAVMSVMRARAGNGVFIVYDLGGGTLDVAIAEGIDGRVSLLAHGGIEMCGGRDWDRLISQNLVRPWLERTFALPENAVADPAYRTLFAVIDHAAERAKIELATRGEAAVSLSEAEVRLQDANGADLYVEVPLTTGELDALIEGKLRDSIAAVRETMAGVGLNPPDVDRIVFVGGPTQYRTVRDKVAFELGIAGALDVDPMTAVAEGAAVFAESVDWSSARRGRKAARGSVDGGGALALSFSYIARTPDPRSKLLVKAGGALPAGAEFQVDSLETGWSSGRQPLRDGATVELSLARPGDNHFKMFVFDAAGMPVELAADRITIARTAAAVDSIPASHSLGVEALDRLGGRPQLTWLVRAGDPLPKKGQLRFHAAESVRAGSQASLQFKLWEGEIVSPVGDNRFIGVLKITGQDFESGVIAQGAELLCDYEIADSGNIAMEVSVPSVGGTFRSGHSFYSAVEAHVDYSAAGRLVADEAERQQERLDAIAAKVDDPLLQQARGKLDEALALPADETDPEKAKQAMDRVHEAKRLLAGVRSRHLKAIRKMELDGCVAFFERHVREHARPSEQSQFDNAVRSAQRAIELNDAAFENYLEEMRGRNWEVLWRQDSFVLGRFRWLQDAPHLFLDQGEYRALCARGAAAARADDMATLREVVNLLEMRRIRSGDLDAADAGANIVVA
ncbi:Hsp70 family protein [Arenimonas composti]|uniref:Heat shock protein Hsp70 n=1 Tax=Arenimonas composti TR7-09 = DSM 18010 TaxID=1121013 RepID=A0A091BGJ6_9GAMM|nr:Hsp70 family protein [Arenimonas composti]KFN50667.1 hypothetical protein P873_05765 [Arenimonas composti TR7-09 = DSM 18010]